jgi:hypothetical protein
VDAILILSQPKVCQAKLECRPDVIVRGILPDMTFGNGHRLMQAVDGFSRIAQPEMSSSKVEKQFESEVVSV